MSNWIWIWVGILLLPFVLGGFVVMVNQPYFSSAEVFCKAWASENSFMHTGVNISSNAMGNYYGEITCRYRVRGGVFDGGTELSEIKSKTFEITEYKLLAWGDK